MLQHGVRYGLVIDTNLATGPANRQANILQLPKIVNLALTCSDQSAVALFLL